ncbi:hypothetical protein [Zoogloea sp.]|uniref:hypothetical protein n=1 Tax=Zoogloea sp. TaxID=49181 RepID=UPI0035B1E2F1
MNYFKFEVSQVHLGHGLLQPGHEPFQPGDGLAGPALEQVHLRPELVQLGHELFQRGHELAGLGPEPVSRALELAGV